MTEVFKLDTPPDAADLAIEWVRFVGSDVCASSPNGLAVFDASSGSLRWEIDDQYGQVTEFQDDSPWHHPPPFCSNEERLAVANWRGIRLVDPKSGRTTKMLAIPDGLEVTALSIAADSSTLTAALSPTSDPINGGSVLYHWDLEKTGYIATNLPASPAGN